VAFFPGKLAEGYEGPVQNPGYRSSGCVQLKGIPARRQHIVKF